MYVSPSSARCKVTVAAPNTPVVAFRQRFHPGDKSPRALPSNRLVGVVIFLGIKESRLGRLQSKPQAPPGSLFASLELHEFGPCKIIGDLSIHVREHALKKYMEWLDS